MLLSFRKLPFQVKNTVSKMIKSTAFPRLILSAFGHEKAEKLLLLGDILYHGPRNPLPEEYCQAALNHLKHLLYHFLC